MRSALILGLAATAALSVPASAGNKNAGDGATFPCSGGTVAFVGPTSLWPPNHKSVQETGLATSKDTAAPLMPTTLELTITSDEAPDQVGSGNTPVDFVVGEDTDDSAATATVPFSVLAERAGGGDGRVYTVDWTATFQDGTSCSSQMATPTDPEQEPFLISVPHDQGKGND